MIRYFIRYFIRYSKQLIKLKINDLLCFNGAIIVDSISQFKR